MNAREAMKAIGGYQRQETTRERAIRKLREAVECGFPSFPRSDRDKAMASAGVPQLLFYGEFNLEAIFILAIRALEDMEDNER